jgi:hypothetical protein
MGLTRVSGDILQTPLNVGVVTATEINAGIVTATTFSGNLTGNVTGNATGLSGTPNITVGTIGATSLNASGTVTATSFSGDGSNLTGIAATTDVRTNSLVVSGITTVAAGSTTAPSISPSGDNNTGIFFPSPDTIAFAEGGAEAFRVDNSGRMLVGITSAISTGGVLQLSGGITFPEIAVAATDPNTLDDYEQGTWTPVISTHPSGNDTGPDHPTILESKYIKIGRVVFIILRYQYLQSPTEGLRVWWGGLPFPAASERRAFCFGDFNTNTSTTVPIAVRVSGSTIQTRVYIVSGAINTVSTSAVLATYTVD